MQQQHVEEGKVNFKVDSGIKSETEIKRKKSPEKSLTFPSMIKKVIEIKDEPLPERFTKTIHLKKYPWEKKVVNSESSEEEVLRKGSPLRSKITKSKTVNLVIKYSKTFNNKKMKERYQQNSMRSKVAIPTW